MNRLMTLAVAGSLALTIPARTDVAVPPVAPLDLVARAGTYELSSERLAAMLATGKLAGNTESAAILTNLWVGYHLAAIAAARGDSLADVKVIDDAMWATIDQELAQKYYDLARRSFGTLDTTGLGDRYLRGEFLAAQHILIAFPEGNSGKLASVQDSVRRKAERIRLLVTNTNFTKLAQEYTDEPGGRENDGRLGVTAPGTWVPEFEAAVRALKPGQVTAGVVKTQFGYHIIRRHLLAEVRDEYIDHLRVHDDDSETAHLITKLESDYALTVRSGIAPVVKGVATEPDAWVSDKTVLATYRDGEFTAGRLARTIIAFPPQASINLRQQLVNAPDSTAGRIIRSIAAKQLMVVEARRTKVTLSASELASVRAMFRQTVLNTNRTLRLDPKSLAGGQTEAERERLAVSHVDQTLERLSVTGGEEFVEMPAQYAAALRATYPWGVNHSGYNRVVSRAGAMRAALDSTRATKPPPKR